MVATSGIVCFQTCANANCSTVPNVVSASDMREEPHIEKYNNILRKYKYANNETINLMNSKINLSMLYEHSNTTILDKNIEKGTMYA